MKQPVCQHLWGALTPVIIMVPMLTAKKHRTWKVIGISKNYTKQINPFRTCKQTTNNTCINTHSFSILIIEFNSTLNYICQQLTWQFGERRSHSLIVRSRLPDRNMSLIGDILRATTLWDNNKWTATWTEFSLVHNMMLALRVSWASWASRKKYFFTSQIIFLTFIFWQSDWLDVG